MEDLKKTSLYDFHENNGAKFVPFAGYSMPVQYKNGVISEHLHTRSKAGFFDVSHMGQIKIWSKNNEKEKLIQELERLMPCDLYNLKENRQTYSLLTNSNGGVIDDLMIANKNLYFQLVVNASQKMIDYQYLKENDLVLDLLEGHDNMNNLQKGKQYELRQSVWNEENNVGYRGDQVQVLGKTDNVMGVDIYRVYNITQDQSMLITGHDIK